jgi:hypothetical protein
MSVYKVTGATSYRGHPPGVEFSADLEPDEERRALARGSIRVVRRAKARADTSQTTGPRQRKRRRKKKEE